MMVVNVDWYLSMCTDFYRGRTRQDGDGGSSHGSVTLGYREESLSSGSS